MARARAAADDGNQQTRRILGFVRDAHWRRAHGLRPVVPTGDPRKAMIKVANRQGVLSVAIFIGILFSLTFVDTRVRDAFSDLFTGGSMTSYSQRAGEVGSALWIAARTQSIDNAPMVVFATIGAVLTLFMFKS
jgi:hypothetical protein